MQFSEVLNLFYFEYEYILDDFIELRKEREEAQKDQEKDINDKYDVEAMQKNAERRMNQYKTPSTPTLPKMPTLSGFRIPI